MLGASNGVSGAAAKTSPQASKGSILSKSPSVRDKLCVALAKEHKALVLRPCEVHSAALCFLSRARGLSRLQELPQGRPTNVGLSKKEKVKSRCAHLLAMALAMLPADRHHTMYVENTYGNASMPS